ncbi:lysophospholipid acyltransferase family protein [Neogemmobacter tilapiae]|uniref:1-acyl-sn-glycerol-3-phosphate acyltransferase n=1 Tax=Neogemmobacter tilapiae TaxID=875041 RepID=A0A918TP94_9RHOB|nr:lysophospholipid acyltransferase family protein [Gemmobacter tilapiae]GHC53500.1 1-acyl-sn-glycerol-3-phosphate acyltransferase [Gemmobacter tilapiae]
MNFGARVAAMAIVVFARAVTAAQARWQGCGPEAVQRVYFANHTSNGDFVLLWSVLPGALKQQTRPVAALDYWLSTPIRAFLGRQVFNAVLIDRRPEERKEDPVAQMAQALDDGSSLILFPEGGRNTTEAPLLPFKTGLYHLAKTRPTVDLVPVWIANLNRVMPKGEVVPVPLICTVTFGAPMHLGVDEEKAAFLERASQALAALAPANARGAV